VSNRPMPHQLAVSSGVIQPKYPAAPRQWVSYMGDQPQPSGALPTPNLSTGVRRDFSRGWGGDRESQFPKLDSAARAFTLGAIGKVLSQGLQDDAGEGEDDDPAAPNLPPPPSGTPPSGPSVDDDDDDASGVLKPLPRASKSLPRASSALPRAVDTLPRASEALPTFTNPQQTRQPLPRATSSRLPFAASALKRQQQANSTGAPRWISGGGRKGPGMSQESRDRIKDDLAQFEGYK
jgi:hypothetical protein